MRTLVWDKLTRYRYLCQIGLYSGFHYEPNTSRKLTGKVSDKDVEIYYWYNLERYRSVAQVQAAHIRLANQVNADKIYAELRSDLAFNEAIHRYFLADDRDRDPSGDLDLIRSQGDRLGLLHKTVLTQKADMIFQPMCIDDALEIARAHGHEDHQLPSGNHSVRFEVDQAVAHERLTAQFEACLRNLLADARVEGL